MFYEECIKKDLEEKKFNAISMANAVSYATPAVDRKSASDKTRHWRQFMDSLDWEKLKSKGIEKFIAYEVPGEDLRKKYGQHYSVVLGDLHQEDDLRVLDYDGHRVLNNFSFKELGEPMHYEG